jgi:hypothetical protein
MEQIIKNLGHQESALVTKCVEAVKREDIGHISKKEFELAMEAAALSIHKDHPDLTWAKAYQRMLETEAGSTLYTGYAAATH